jgi:hypothetical protein
MKTDAQIRANVMRRVYATYYLREVSKPAPRMLVLTGLALALAGSVSVINIINNALSTNGLSGLAVFVLSAFVTTSILVKTVTVGIVAMIAWFAVDTAKNIALAPDQQLQTTN